MSYDEKLYEAQYLAESHDELEFYEVDPFDGSYYEGEPWGD